MAKVDKVVLDKVKRFVVQLENAGFHVTDAYIFGSFATGTTDEWSDIDVAIISPQLSDDRFEERVILMKIAYPIDERIEPLPFNPSDFSTDDPLVLEIKKNGIAIN